MLLLNFLDFLETIAYFCKANSLSVADVQNLLGYSLVFYYDVFERWLKYRQKKIGEGKYSEIQWLVKKIRQVDSKSSAINCNHVT